MGIYRKVGERVQEMATVEGCAALRSQEVASTPQQSQGNSWAGKEVKKKEGQIMARIFTAAFVGGHGQSMLSSLRTGKFELLQ